MSETAIEREARRGLGQDTGKRIILLICLVLELLMMAVGLWPAVWLVLRYGPAAETPGQWVWLVLGAVLLFNYGYLIALLVLRIIVPYPPEGTYLLTPGKRPPKPLMVFMLNALLAKARHDPPWAMMFSSALTRLPPLAGLYTRFFGPHTSSITLGDTIECLDPYMVEAGDNVQFGYGCAITAHHFDNRSITIGRVKIGDHAVIGGKAVLMAGVEVGHHAVVGVHAVVLPGTKIGPYEFWAGMPAKCIKSLRADETADAPACVTGASDLSERD